MRRIIIDGNQCYEIDEECMKKKRQKKDSAKTQQKTVRKEQETPVRKKN